MSTKEPTTPKDGTTTVSPAEHWHELQARASGESETKEALDASQEESGETKGEKRRSFPRHVRLVVPAALAAFAVALALIVVHALVEAGSTHRSRPASDVAHAKAPKTDRGRSSRTRWMREPDRGASRQQGRTPSAASHVKRHVHSPSEPKQPAPSSDAPSQSPVTDAPSEPSAPVLDPSNESKEKQGLHDGATESTEFGL